MYFIYTYMYTYILIMQWLFLYSFKDIGLVLESYPHYFISYLLPNNAAWQIIPNLGCFKQ